MMQGRYKVFISHASHDRGVALLLRYLVRSLGADCWIDAKNIETGAHWRIEIEEHLRSARELLVLASPRFMQSRWLDYEVGIAVGAGIKIVPLLYDCVPSRIADFEVVRHLQGVHIDDIEGYVRDLKQRITPTVEPDPTGVPSPAGTLSPAVPRGAGTQAGIQRLQERLHQAFVQRMNRLED